MSRLTLGAEDAHTLGPFLFKLDERRSLLVTANQPFGEWGKIFPDQAMTLAVIDRLVHHATIFEMNVESYRRPLALGRPRQRSSKPASRKAQIGLGTSLSGNSGLIATTAWRRNRAVRRVIRRRSLDGAVEIPIEPPRHHRPRHPAGSLKAFGRRPPSAWIGS